MKLPSFSAYFDRSVPIGERISKGYLREPDQTYRQFPAVNASMLKSATPAEMLESITGSEPGQYDSESRAAALTEGTLLHCAVLEPWKFGIGNDPWGKPRSWDEFFVESPTQGLATAKATKVREENPGKLLIKPEHLTTMQKAAEAIRWNPAAAEILAQPAMTEASGYAFDLSAGVRLKWRVDFMPLAPETNDIVDVKTTSAPLYKFEDECWKFGYFIQAAFYLHCHELLTGYRPEKFIFIAVTKSPPYMSRVFHVQNLPEAHPLYTGSALQKARDRIGIGSNQSGRLERLASFITSASDTAAAQERGIDLPASELRKLWPAYENEDPQLIGLQ